ncbi:MAG: hypothetical protein ABSH45_14030 [Bryobacteraceae bacterium]
MKSRFVVAGIVLAGFAVAASWSLRLAWADYWARQETLVGLQKALVLTGDQAAYYVRLAALLSEDDPVRATAMLQRAVALNPADARSWIELGLQYEANGEGSRAERSLLRAAEEDKEYLPRWTLANHYFRHNDTARFWFWAKAAAAMGYGDPLPIFRLCGNVEEDGKLIDRLEIRKPDMRASYLSYLVDQGRMDLVGQCSRKVLEGHRESDIPLLLTVCDRLLDTNRVADGIEIWNSLAETRRIPFGRVNPAMQSLLTNGNFGTSPTSHGFDWRLPGGEGITVAREESDAGLRLTFSGTQAESCEPLAQLVPVRAGTNYGLKWRYRTSGIAPGTGLSWRVTDTSGRRTLSVARSMSSEDEGEGELTFATPAGCRLVCLALVYQRASGTTRIEGYVVLRGVSLAPVGHSPPEGGRSPLMK